ncbi:hypothetical protein NDU88_009291 [Pleurodeles waltl]|uniref:Uncharacterized protein n=1 Tax=Pleurodeles waltl TaxID=8319 RepID=A0AAV7QR87_PLEWA|nr:hypothetical protein NDU88_009291 [Pleurodeles waltl]
MVGPAAPGTGAGARQEAARSARRDCGDLRAASIARGGAPLSDRQRRGSGERRGALRADRASLEASGRALAETRRVLGGRNRCWASDWWR